MSTFVVFGMTRSMAVSIAKKKVSEHKKTQDQWMAAVNEMADEILANQKLVKQLSDYFDAPQFSQDFMALARKTDDGTRLEIRYKKESGISKKTGRPIKKWAVY